MALPLVVDKLENVSEEHRTLYKENDGKFTLDVEGLEDTGALKRAKDHERDARKKAEDKASSLQTQLDDLQKQINDKNDDDATKKGDVEALNKSWQEKLDKSSEKISAKDKVIEKLLIDTTALTISADLAIKGSAEALLPHVRSRLGAEIKDDAASLVILDKDGKTSALTQEELIQEITNDKALAPLIASSKASGSGAPGGSGGGAPTETDLSKMSKEQKLDYFRKKRE